MLGALILPTITLFAATATEESGMAVGRAIRCVWMRAVLLKLLFNTQVFDLELQLPTLHDQQKIQAGRQAGFES